MNNSTNKVLSLIERHQQREQRLRDAMSVEIRRCEKQISQCHYALGASILGSETSLELVSVALGPEQNEVVEKFKNLHRERIELQAALQKLKG